MDAVVGATTGFPRPEYRPSGISFLEVLPLGLIRVGLETRDLQGTSDKANLRKERFKCLGATQHAFRWTTEPLPRRLSIIQPLVAGLYESRGGP